MSRRHTNNARTLRKHQTDAERVIWRHLRAYRLREFKFRRQHPLGPYIVDFVCMSKRLVIEIDGGQHLASEYDHRRDAWLRAQGFHVLRVWNNEVLSNIDGVLACIAVALGACCDARAREPDATQARTA